MKVTGIIAEYNPFHNGHAYHIKQAKELTNADYIVIIMSGDYVQRGTPAIVDKYKRAEMALHCGADLVLELPCAFACASAEFFAEGSIGILDDLGCVDTICFGAETADTSMLSSIAKQLLYETETFKNHLNQFLSNGFTYPKARSEALLLSFPQEKRQLYESILETPNNILGIEYLKAIKRRHSFISAVPIPRVDSGYHDTTLLENHFSSATAIRKLLKESTSSSLSFHTLKGQMPFPALSLLTELHSPSSLLFEDDFSSLLQLRLLEENEYTSYLDVGSELSNRIKQLVSPDLSFTELAKKLKSRQYTFTRIQRALLHILLDIKTEQMQRYQQNDFHSYARILGFKKSCIPLLKEIRRTSSIPIIQQPAKDSSLLSPVANELFSLDRKAHRLYEMVRCQKYHLPYQEEWSKKPLILEQTSSL